MICENCFGCGQPSRRPDRVGHVLVRRRRPGADLPGRVHRALLRDGAGDLGNGDAHRREPIGLQPDAQRVVAGAEDTDFADARHAVQRVDDVDVRVVREEERVVRVRWRQERDHHHRQARRLAQCQAVLRDVGRQVRLCLRDPVLDVDLIDVGVGADVERHRQLHRPVVAVGRLHVEHVVDAVDLLFERRRHGLFDGLRVGAVIGRRHDDLWRHDVRELRHRERAQ